MNIKSLEKLNFGISPRLPSILQSEAGECALAAICMIANYHGHKVDLFTLRRQYPISLKGANLKQLVDIGNTLSLNSRVVKVELEHIGKVKCPAILHWDMNHFVVLKSTSKNGIVISDPAKGEVNISYSEANKLFTGIAVEITPSASFKKKDEQQHLGLSLLWKSATGIKSSIFQIFLLSTFLQLFVLTFPFFIKFVADNIIISGDKNFLRTLGIGFFLIVFARVFTEAFRSWVLVYVRSKLNLQLFSNLFRHLLRLPMGWFEKRFVGDIISRFGSLEFVKDLLSKGFVEGIIDGLMAILTLTMMFWLSPTLALITAASVTGYSIVRLIIYPSLRSRTKEYIQLKSKSTGLFYESVKSVESIKTYNGETKRQESVENANARWINSEIQLDKLNIFQNISKELFYGFEYVSVIWLGALSIIEGTMTIGVLFAYLAYRQFFSISSQTFLDKIFEWRMLNVHLTRIADIALEEEELNLQSDYPVVAKETFKGKIELKNVSFKYHKNDPYIFENINITIDSGDCAVIQAPSGYGKSTLMKIIMGLLKPTSGQVLVDGIDINQLGLINYRSITSSITQGEDLLSGSIGDNISFFSNNLNEIALLSAAKDACILDDINKMPMAFHSLTGDMGSTLSGGQIQRILIARALYKKPCMLFLDEATSALDLNTERKINSKLKSLGITRVMIAHREETVKMANKVIDLTNIENHSKALSKAAS